MTALQHDNGQPIVEIYGPKTTEARGGTIAFNLNDPDGHRFDYRRVEYLANQAQISLRTGCFCNPGSGELIGQLTPEHIAPFFTSGEKVSFDQLVDTVATEYQINLSSIRISVGIASNFADVYCFMAFVEGFKNQWAHTVNTLPFERSTVADTA
jgi:molybdenum cofactor sulfurtransferase